MIQSASPGSWQGRGRRRALTAGAIALLALVACGIESPELTIARRPQAMWYGRGVLNHLEDPEAAGWAPGLYDLRSFDLTGLDLSDQGPVLRTAMFDDLTRWPEAAAMPADLSIPRIRELGMDPGLAVRELHAQGITGRGVGIAIIDQTLRAMDGGR